MKTPSSANTVIVDKIHNYLACFCALIVNYMSEFPCRIEMGEEPLVKTAATVFQDMCYNYRDQLSAGIICAGWDKVHGGQVIIYIFKLIEERLLCLPKCRITLYDRFISSRTTLKSMLYIVLYTRG